MRSIAQEWLKAGAEILTTATYQLTLDAIKKEFDIDDKEAEKCLYESTAILNEERQLYWASMDEAQQKRRRYPQIALSMGPLNAILEDGDEYKGVYRDDVSQEDLYNFHLHRATKLSSICTSDVLCFETIGNVQEAIAIANAMSQTSLQHLPFWISFQCHTDEHLPSGEPVADAVTAVLRECRFSNLVAIGINCYQASWTHQLVNYVSQAIQTFGNQGQEQATQSTRRWLQIIGYPNSGEVWNEDKKLSGKRLSLPSWTSVLLSSGANIVGGCCGVGPASILALREKVIVEQGNSHVQ